MSAGATYAILIITYIISNVIMFSCMFWSFRKKTETGKLLGIMIIFCILILWSYFTNYVSTNEIVMSYFCSCERIFLDWAIYFMVGYVFSMTGDHIPKELKFIYAGILFADSALIITNPINHFVADIYYVRGFYFDVAKMDSNIFYYVHTGLCVIMLTAVLVALIKKALITSKFYKAKYYILATLELCVIFFNSVFALAKTHSFDLSILLYGVAVGIIYYNTFSYFPIWLSRKLQEYTNNNITDAMVYYDIDNRALRHNDNLERICSEDIWKNKEKLHEFIGNPVEGTSIKAVGDKFYKVNYSPMYDKQSKEYIGAAFILHDATDSVKRLEREHHIATFDKLTGIYNRTGFFEAATKFLNEHHLNSSYALMVSGIYNFKGINTSYGLSIGDKVLIQIAERFREFHHDFNIVYGRTTEGKFACIVPIERIDEIVNETTVFPIKLENETEVYVNMKHGFVLLSDMTVNLDVYYEQALLALAKCKRVSRSPVTEYTKGMDDELKRQQMLISEMHSAIAKREFFLELQPQIHLKEHKITGAEALVRWNHPELGRIPPGEFISLFESNGFITDLDEFVWDEAASIIKRLNDSGDYTGHISVNVSQEDINNINVVEKFTKIINKYGIEPEKLHVEITESACADDRTKLIDTMNALRERGFLVEIDDFGSGYSSLNALMHLPFDIVKLDMLFMKNNNFDIKSETIVNAMTQMIHGIGAEIIVEGVETDETVKSAMRFEGDIAQGYFYSKPVSVEDFIEFVKNF